MTQQAGSMTSPMMEPGPDFGVADFGAADVALAAGAACFAADVALAAGAAGFAADGAAFSCAIAAATTTSETRSVPAMPALDIFIPVLPVDSSGVMPGIRRSGQGYQRAAGPARTAQAPRARRGPSPFAIMMVWRAEPPPRGAPECRNLRSAAS